MMKFAYLFTLLSIVNAELVSLPVSINVNLPLVVQPGVSFGEAAAQFVENNGLPKENAKPIEEALIKSWNEMKQKNANIEQCIDWQLNYGVSPKSDDRGSMTDELVQKWNEYKCSEYAFPEVPVSVIDMNVNIGNDNVVALKAFAGETIDSAVRRFTERYQVDYQKDGQTLIEALVKKYNDKVNEAMTLFSLPIDVDGKVVALDVHAGDVPQEIAKAFCEKYNVHVENVPRIVQAIVTRASELREELQGSAEQAAETVVNNVADHVRSLTIPIMVDDRKIELKLFDGDNLTDKIKAFCDEHGLNFAEVGEQLENRIAQSFATQQ